MSHLSGVVLDCMKHLRQPITDILSTRTGTRLSRRDYGSSLPDLTDQPMTASNILRIYAATEKRPKHLLSKLGKCGECGGT
jgi:hypothetical protein